jgi:divalent metal cation (Fe/Co/Zn/Cd) transporter
MLNKSDYFILAAALVSMILSIALWFTIDQDAGLFVAIWVPSILGFGAYFKIIKYGGRQ